METDGHTAKVDGVRLKKFGLPGKPWEVYARIGIAAIIRIVLYNAAPFKGQTYRDFWPALVVNVPAFLSPVREK